MTLLAETRGLTRRFGSFVAVDGVDMAVQEGEVVGLLGANGAGKTTLIRVLLGLLAPSDGETLLFGGPPSSEARRRLGYVPQGLGLYEDLTPGENLAFSRAVFGAGIGTDGGLDALPDVPVGQLPLGTQRRVAFAAALDHAPDLLVLDEPTSGVGPLASARLWETIRGATEAGAGALVSTHNLEEAEQCDRLVIMSAGRVVASGTMAGIIGDGRAVLVETADWTTAFDALQREGVRPVLAGRALRIPDRALREIQGLLGDIPARLAEVPATLEESFLRLATAGSEERPH